MSTLVLSIGNDWRPEPVFIRVTNMPDEVNPEHVWQAANRINEPVDDCRQLARLASGSTDLGRGLCFIRRQLDALHAPSMSVNDYFDVLTDGGVALVRYKVMPAGWATTPFPHTAGLQR
jgi:hypothetical protein